MTKHTVPRTRALVARGDGSPPEVLEILLDELGPGEVLVEIDASAVCRTELATVTSAAEPGAPVRPGPPTVLGHAAAGRVSRVGDAVRRVRPGDRVVVVGTRQCGRCYYCVNDAPGACEEIFTYMQRRVGETPSGEAVFSDGGIGAHAERLTYPESNVVVIDSDLEPAVLAMLGCGVTSGAGAVVDVARVRPGESVAVSGCGHLGLWAVQAARLAGATTIIALDPDPSRRELALAVGATHALDPAEDPVAAVQALTEGRGADVGIEAAGTTLAMEQSFALTRRGGRVVPNGLESETAVVRLPNLEYALNSRRILSSQCGGGDVARLVPRLERLLAAGALRPEPVLTGRYELGEAGLAYAALADPAHFTGVFVRNDGEAER